MKKILMLIIIGMLAVGFAYSQSLADAAKKEKARREQFQKEGKKSKIVTTEDIEKAKAKSGEVETTAASTETAATPSSESNKSEAKPDSSSDIDTSGEAEKQRIIQQIDTLKSDIEQLKKQRDAEDAKLTGGVQTYNPGEIYKNIRNFNDQIKNKEDQISDLERQLQQME
jgi:cytochrome c556